MDNRFELVQAEGFGFSKSGICRILLDTETGVHYLAWQSGYAGGITPLLGPDGRPVIKK